MTEIYYANIQQLKLKEEAYYQTILSKDRYQAIQKQKTQAGKKQSIAAGLLQKKVFELHNMDEKHMPYTSNAFGKRMYEGFDVNLSHSHEMVACVWSDDFVGIDIEKIRVYDARIPKRFFSSKEQNWIEEQKDLSRAFFLLWTQKESVAKQKGTGINSKFFSRECVLPKKNTQIYELPQGNGWIHYYEIQQYIFCLCTKDAQVQGMPIELILENEK